MDYAIEQPPYRFQIEENSPVQNGKVFTQVRYLKGAEGFKHALNFGKCMLRPQFIKI